MSLKFDETKGEAVYKSVKAYEYKDGENVVSLIDGVLPGYVHWLKDTNN